MKLLNTICISALLGCATLAAQAQNGFPERPIVIVVPYPAGRTSDAQVRMIQAPLEKLLVQPIIVENTLGASGALAQSSTPAEFASPLSVEYRQWRDVITKNNIKSD